MTSETFSVLFGSSSSGAREKKEEKIKNKKADARERKKEKEKRKESYDPSNDPSGPFSSEEKKENMGVMTIQSEPATMPPLP